MLNKTRVSGDRSEIDFIGIDYIHSELAVSYSSGRNCRGLFSKRRNSPGTSKQASTRPAWKRVEAWMAVCRKHHPREQGEVPTYPWGPGGCNSG